MNIHSTATKDCYGHPQLKIAKPRYTSCQKTTNVTHIGCMTILNFYRGDDRLQRIQLSPSTDNRRSRPKSLAVTWNTSKGCCIRRSWRGCFQHSPWTTAQQSDVQDTYEHVLSLTPHPSWVCLQPLPNLHWPSDRWTRCRSCDLVTATVDWPVTSRRGQGQAGHWHDEGLRMSGHVHHTGHAGAVRRSS